MANKYLVMRSVTELASLQKIVHVDMDAFYTSVEQRDDARFRARAVVVAWKGKRSVVCAAYEARTFGVRSAVPAITAGCLYPEAIFVPPDFTRYKAVSLAVRAIFQRATRTLSNRSHWMKPISM